MFTEQLLGKEWGKVGSFFSANNLTSTWEVTEVQSLTYHVEEYNDF